MRLLFSRYLRPAESKFCGSVMSSNSTLPAMIPYLAIAAVSSIYMFPLFTDDIFSLSADSSGDNCAPRGTRRVIILVESVFTSSEIRLSASSTTVEEVEPYCLRKSSTSFPLTLRMRISPPTRSTRFTLSSSRVVRYAVVLLFVLSPEKSHEPRYIRFSSLTSAL